jgi:hypothetical protein
MVRLSWSILYACALAAFGGLAQETAPAGDPNAAPAPHQPPNGVYEVKGAWGFDDNDKLYFSNPNQNADGKRYVFYKGYALVVGAETIEGVDPRPWGLRMTFSRGLRSEKGAMTDRELFDRIQDTLKDLRYAREPEPVYVPVYCPIHGPNCWCYW